MDTSTRLPGHGLRDEGKPFEDDGRGGTRRADIYSEPDGFGLCSCGARSGVLGLDADRRRWHRDVHKAQIRAAKEADLMTVTTDRICWTDNGMGGFDGYVGTSKRAAFELWQAPADAGFPAGDWVITSQLPLPDASSPGYTYSFSGKDPGELRARAERRLEEFISSLGAAFPEPVPPRREEVWP